MPSPPPNPSGTPRPASKSGLSGRRPGTSSAARTPARRSPSSPPPKYDQKDFENAAAVWRLRGKLDVPKERFIAYPTASPPPGAAGTKGALVFGWAGWDHLQQLQAAVELWQEEIGLHGHNLIPRATRREREETGSSSSSSAAPADASAQQTLRLDAAARERLLPILQTMADLLPWVRQWHEEDAPDFEAYVSEQALRLETSLDEARAYRRPARTAARARKPAADGQLPIDLGAPTRTPARSAALSPDDVIAAVRALDTGDGAPVAELGGKLGASAAAVKKAVDGLVEAGRLVERKKRPRMVSCAVGKGPEP